ncbi:MAG: hypothetical protein U0900_23085 [Myxococcota bacterium]
MPIRITVQSTEAATTIVRLEGRLGESDLPVLESGLAEVGDRPFDLDLSGLRWLDPAAADRLAALLRQGAGIVASSPFVDQLLARTALDSPPRRDAANHASEPNGR